MNSDPKLKLIKSLADPTRLRIVQRVLECGEIACQQLIKEFKLSQPTMSHHFNKLVDSGVLLNRKEGVLWFYSINKPFLSEIGLDVSRFLSN